jgi:hypothetical protein
MVLTRRLIGVAGKVSWNDSWRPIIAGDKASGPRLHAVTLIDTVISKLQQVEAINEHHVLLYYVPFTSRLLNADAPTPLVAQTIPGSDGLYRYQGVDA